MTTQEGRRTPVIAVFGSNEEPTLEPSERIGREVAATGCVLLTGGGVRLDQGQVKERAMRGARDAESKDAAAWRIGVLGVESADVAFTAEGSRAILEPNLGDGRNYLNAAMCDVAIALPGGDGTKSEVAFALALGRPVVLVGSAWDTVFPPGEDREAREALIESAKNRVEGDHGTALGVLVAQAYDDLLEADVRVERYELDHPAAEIVAAARGLAGDDDAGLVGDLPMLTDRPDLDPLADQYRDWLAGVDRDR